MIKKRIAKNAIIAAFKKQIENDKAIYLDDFFYSIYGANFNNSKEGIKILERISEILFPYYGNNVSKEYAKRALEILEQEKNK